MMTTITQKVHITALIVACLVGTLAIFAKQNYDYEQQIKQTELHLKGIADAFNMHLIDQVWDMDYEALENTIEAIKNLPEVDQVSLELFPTMTWFGDTDSSIEYVQYQSFLKKVTPYQTVNLGELTLQCHHRHVKDELINTTWATILVCLIVTLSILLTYVVMIKLTVMTRIQALLGMTEHLTNLDIKNEHRIQMVEQQIHKTHDEFEPLQEAIHSLWENAAQAIDSWRKDDERWTLAAEASRQAVWEYNCIQQEIYFSSHWKHLLGYEDDEIADKLEEWVARVHPNDKRQFTEAFDNHLYSRSPMFESFYRMKCKNGDYRLFFTRGKAIKFDDGVPSQIVGLTCDIQDVETLHLFHLRS